MEFNFEDHVNKLFILSGKILSQEDFNKVINFIKYLPHDPVKLKLLNTNYYSSILKDYDKGIFFDVRLYMTGKENEDSEFRFTIVNQGLFKREGKVKSNNEAMKLVKELYEIKSVNETGYDIFNSDIEEVKEIISKV